MNILVIGAGYVGLVTATCFAEMGHRVTCLDVDVQKIHLLREGKPPFFEPKLEELVTRNRNAGRLRFSCNYEEGIQGVQICFLALPTPSQPDGSCDCSSLFSAVEMLASVLSSSLILVVKSTAPVGTSHALKERLIARLRERGCTAEISLAANPEFLKQGTAVSDFMKPDRILLGVEDVETERVLRKIYQGFSFNHNRILGMDIRSAELAKYAANAMLATRISFMNELALLCEEVGANVQSIRSALGSDARIGYSFLYPGIGYGGSCFPKDLQALLATAKAYGVELKIISSVHEVNERQKRLLGQKMVQALQPLPGKTIAIWGLAFKPETDDLRGAPSLTLIEELTARGAKLQLFDPIAIPNAKRILQHLPNITFCQNEYEAATNADAIALLTEWKQFRFIDLNTISSLMRTKFFFDGRNQFDPQNMRSNGFIYYAIGLSDK